MAKVAWARGQGDPTQRAAADALDIAEEFAVLTAVSQHPNVVRAVGVLTSSLGRPVLLLEAATETLPRLVKYKDPQQCLVSRDCLVQLVLGLSHMHGRPFLHLHVDDDADVHCDEDGAPWIKATGTGSKHSPRDRRRVYSRHRHPHRQPRHSSDSRVDKLEHPTEIQDTYSHKYEAKKCLGLPRHSCRHCRLRPQQRSLAEWLRCGRQSGLHRAIPMSGVLDGRPAQGILHVQ